MSSKAKEFLLQSQHIRARIRAKQERIRSWQELATSITAPIAGDGGSTPSRDVKKLERYMTEVVSLENEILDQIHDLQQAERDFYTVTSQLNNPAMQLVLELRYLNGLNFMEISGRIHYSYRWVIELHRRSLQKLEECMQMQGTS